MMIASLGRADASLYQVCPKSGPSLGSQNRPKAAVRQGLMPASLVKRKITVPATSENNITPYCYRFAFT